MRYLIIEDEPLAQEELIRMLKSLDPTFTLLASIDSVKETVEWLNNNEHPDIVFMDIHLSDNICFDIFNKTKVNAPIIFTTAYDQYAIEAFKTNGIAYLLKPIEEEELISALKKFKALTQTNIEVSNIHSKIQQLSTLNRQQITPNSYKERVLAKVGDNYQHISMNDAAYFHSEDHYTFVTTKDKQRYIINYTLDSLVDLLNPQQFFRISRQFILNINAIENISKHLNGRLKVSINPPFSDDVYVARNRVQTFLAWLDGENITIQ
ncbi:MAG: response regulator transcription factor [Paludibacteraceae bacterium]|nr:response regulator transcription factor [Paludibacteraceae bacterium]